MDLHLDNWPPAREVVRKVTDGGPAGLVDSRLAVAASDPCVAAVYSAVKNDQTSAGTQLQGQVVEQVLGGVAHEL